MPDSALMERPTRHLGIQALFEPFDVRAFMSPVNPNLIQDLHVDEASFVTAMADARRAEFATARACARTALADLGIHAPILRSDGGAPQWPPGTAGSISHTRGFCLAVGSTDTASIGIDVEEVARMKSAVERRILIDAERTAVEGLTDRDRQRFVATIFAAKEAFYKAHYEIDARYLGFDAVHVILTDDGVRFGPASGEVADDVLAAASGRFLLEAGRVIVGVSIDVTTPTSPLPSRP